MKSQQNTKVNISEIGQNIGLDKGQEFIFNSMNSGNTNNLSYIIGKEIIEKILTQPGCVGIKLYDAINELNEKTLVFLGIDAEGKEIIKYSSVNTHGEYNSQPAIIADRIKTIPFDTEEEWWILD